MRPLRILRLALLAVLLPFVVVLVLMVRQPPAPHSDPVLSETAGARAEGIEFVELSGGERRLSLRAAEVKSVREDDLRVRDVQRLEVTRKDAPPLVVAAQAGRITGTPGLRMMRLDGGVQVEDEREALTVRVPALEVDEEAGEARSLGPVKFRGPNYEGAAASLVYGLEGQPSVLSDLEARRDDGASLRADVVRLLDGTRDVELSGDVVGTRADDRVRAPEMRLLRGPSRGLERLSARGGVSVSLFRPEEPEARVDAEEATVIWGEDGEVRSLSLANDCRLHRGPNSLAAHAIRMWREPGTSDWRIDARGAVRTAGPSSAGESVLTAATLIGTLDGDWTLREAEAEGRVRFDSPDTSAESPRATYRAGAGERRIELIGEEGLRPRLASGRTRVEADRVSTDPRATRLEAEGKVKSSLLPAGREQGGTATADGLFRGHETVHFVSARLEANVEASSFLFTGSVRGWQRERNLAADRVAVFQKEDRLLATGSVTTRLPRRADDRAVAEADFVQVAAENLDYRGLDRVAFYTGGVRVRQAEGWMESEDLEVQLSTEGSAAEEIRAVGGVRFEFQTPGGEGTSKPVTGTGDRAHYRPDTQIVTLFGDRAPATVRRDDEGGETTTGRVLRYHLDTGAYEVSSGERDRARIRTPEK